MLHLEVTADFHISMTMRIGSNVHKDVTSCFRLSVSSLQTVTLYKAYSFLKSKMFIHFDPATHFEMFQNIINKQYT